MTLRHRTLWTADGRSQDLNDITTELLTILNYTHNNLISQQVEKFESEYIVRVQAQTQ